MGASAPHFEKLGFRSPTLPDKTGWQGAIDNLFPNLSLSLYMAVFILLSYQWKRIGLSLRNGLPAPSAWTLTSCPESLQNRSGTCLNAFIVFFIEFACGNRWNHNMTDKIQTCVTTFCLPLLAPRGHISKNISKIKKVDSLSVDFVLCKACQAKQGRRIDTLQTCEGPIDSCRHIDRPQSP